MDPEIEEILQKDYNVASHKGSRSGSPSLDPWEECCKRARSVSFGSTHTNANIVGIKEENNGDYFPSLQPVPLSFVYDPDNHSGAHALSSIANPVSTSSITPSASSSNPSTCF
ncbi:hypothetical protein DFH08DRAFT_811482 [Mycena albidolilacea]|uniref:Uncharacterized protein n=1 Tax=Mycena albidolilacea TaxID=1033008 RepID=A0AAD6ZVD2_9AGAR|nr:hypothetical protein DFH08DRAFT_811482 [Mycena albidolilacea]